MTTHSSISCLKDKNGQKSLVGYSLWGQKSWTRLSNSFTFENSRFCLRGGVIFSKM